VAEKKNLCPKVDVSCAGKRSYLFLRKRAALRKYYEDVVANPQFLKAEGIGEELSKLFLSGEYDEIYLAYNRFHSPLSQEPVLEKVLPIEPENLLTGGKAIPSDYIFEPEKSELLGLLVPKYLYFRFYYAFLENSAGEHGARMTAMDKATKNAIEMIDHYTLLRNRARQAAITTELTEIVVGAEALKG
jgi:F-type H+-transporting ATPase subunit gamma